MSKYEEFAFIYDELMDETPYSKWCEFVQDHLEKMKKVDLVCELGCGTGNMTVPLAQAGYEMIGIDLSENMLMVAREKAVMNNVDILLLQQDMTQFELYGTVDMIVSSCDSLNYVKGRNELLKVFKHVANYLNPEGLFIFDLNSRYKFETVYDNKTFTEVEEEYAYIWKNTFDCDLGINMYEITFFVRDEGDEYTRFDEFHEEYTYSIDEVKELLKEADLTCVDVYDDYSYNKATDYSERVTFVAKSNKLENLK